MSSAAVTPIRSVRPTNEEPVWMSPAQVCEFVPGLTLRDLEDHRSRGTGPKPSYATPRKVVYLRADVNAWLLSKRRATREQP